MDVCTKVANASISIGKELQNQEVFDFSLLQYIRLFLCLFIAIKLVEIIFIKRRKLSTSERIRRKFVFSHGIDMIKSFSPEEVSLMSLTIENTLKNTIQCAMKNPHKLKKKEGKSVSFILQSNVYYDPSKPKDDQMLQTENFEKQNESNIETQDSQRNLSQSFDDELSL